MRGFLLASFLRDVLLLVCSGLVVSSTALASFAEVMMSHLVAGVSESEIMQGLTSQPLLVFYYVTLGLFMSVVIVLVAYYALRFFWELSVLGNRQVEKTEAATACFVNGLRRVLFVAFFLLLALFVCYWIFWGRVLSTSARHLRAFLEALELGSADPSQTLAPSIGRGVMGMLGLLAVFLVSVSFNMLIVMRAIFNKLSLLGTDPRGEVNRVSFFRVRPVDLTTVCKNMYVFRQLWVSYLADSLELLTLAVWALYPLLVLVLWASERSCASQVALDRSEGLSPLLGCVVAARVPMGVVSALMGLVLLVLLVCNLLRFLEERALLIQKIHNPAACRLSSVWAFGPLFGLLFLLSALGAIVSILMLAKPLYSHLDQEQRISLAYPGLVMLAGCIFSLFYIGKKLTFTLAIHLNPRLSFFFEGAMSLTTEQNVENLAPDDDNTVELNLYSPIFDDPILY